MSLRSTGNGCTISVSSGRWRTLTEEGDLFRLVRSAVRRGSTIATAMGRLIFAVIAVLILTVGALSTESRIPQVLQNTGLRHTSKISRMTECGGEELPPRQVSEFRAVPPVLTPVTVPYCSPEIPLAEFTDTSRAHGLRAPPLA
jgi:hypothetical protein